MFETVQAAAPDPILGLTEAYKQDSSSEKINLTVGVYRDADGNTPILNSVKQAEDRILSDETSKNYLSIEGSQEYAQVVQELLFGSGHEIIVNRRAVIAHTPGGTGALRVAADFIKQSFPRARVWLTEPTWPNHPNILQLPSPG